MKITSVSFLNQMAAQLSTLKTDEQSFINGYLAGLLYAPRDKTESTDHIDDDTKNHTDNHELRFTAETKGNQNGNASL